MERERVESFDIVWEMLREASGKMISDRCGCADDVDVTIEAESEPWA